MTVLTEMRSAVRFPLHLPVTVWVNQEEHMALTQDISAGGVLLETDVCQEVGSPLEFILTMPSQVIGAPKDVLVKCTGRVVRCKAMGEGRCSIAAIIEDYSFSRNS